MKKILSIFLFFMALITLSACSGSEEEGTYLAYKLDGYGNKFEADIKDGEIKIVEIDKTGDVISTNTAKIDSKNKKIIEDDDKIDYKIGENDELIIQGINNSMTFYKEGSKAEKKATEEWENSQN